MASYKNLDLKQLHRLAAALALTLKGRGATIGLTGTLGAGKTTFVQGFAKALGIKKISSPTFVIRHDHRARRSNLYHLDFYRLTKASQLKNLGLMELLGRNNLILIEWVEKFSKIEKLCDIVVTFKIKPGNVRDITIKAN